jgi:hypothetical protein
MRPSAPVLLATLNLLLLGAIALAWLSGRTAWTPPSLIAPDPALFAPPGEAGEAGEALASSVELHARPLFAKSRRPPPPPAETDEPPDAGEAPAGSIDGAALVGLVGGGEQGVALVSLDSEIRRVPVGGQLAGWRLTEIRGLVARFSNATGEQRDLPIKPPARQLQPTAADQAEPDQPESEARAGADDTVPASTADLQKPGGLQAQIAERQRRRALLRKHQESQ